MEINGDEPTKQVLKYRFSIVPKKEEPLHWLREQNQQGKTNGNL
jgi:hypothetical protein